MARWIQVLKDGEWAFIRPEAVDGFWVYDQGDRRYIHFDVGGRSFYLLYPLDHARILDIFLVQDWLDFDYDGVLTLWHFTIPLGLHPLGVARFLTKVAFYNTLHYEADLRSFRNVSKVKQLLEDVIVDHANTGEPITTFAEILYPDTPGWLRFDLPKFDQIKTDEGILIKRDGNKYYIYLPSNILEKKGSNFVERYANLLASFYEFARAIKSLYPPDIVL